VTKELVAAVPGRRALARFTGRDVRRMLAPGRYALEVRAGKARGGLGLAATTALRITT
jgi:hypothetical protein